jgi:hypothetical protein
MPSARSFSYQSAPRVLGRRGHFALRGLLDGGRESRRRQHLQRVSVIGSRFAHDLLALLTRRHYAAKCRSRHVNIATLPALPVLRTLPKLPRGTLPECANAKGNRAVWQATERRLAAATAILDLGFILRRGFGRQPVPCPATAAVNAATTRMTEISAHESPLLTR